MLRITSETVSWFGGRNRSTSALGNGLPFSVHSFDPDVELVQIFCRRVFSRRETVLNDLILYYSIGRRTFTGLYLINTLRHPLELESILRFRATI